MSWLGRWKNPGAPVNGSRVLGTQYTPSASAYVEHFVSVQMTVTTGQSSQVSALCDSASPPTVERARCATNVIGVQTFELSWISAPGDNCKLVATGTGAAAIVAQWEVPLGAQTE